MRLVRRILPDRIISLLRPGKNFLMGANRIFVTSIRRLLHEEILVIGDSHCAVFRNSYIRKRFSGLFFNCRIVQGATVSGLDNPNSKTRALPIFRESIKKFGGSTILTLIGEVDTGFVIWYRAKKHSEPVENSFNAAVHNYKIFLASCRKSHAVICISAPLPTIRDDDDWGDVANLRREIAASQYERTQLTLRFNKEMGDFCHTNDIGFIDLDRDSLATNGLVYEHLLNKNKTDHHYDQDSYAKLLAPGLKKALDKNC